MKLNRKKNLRSVNAAQNDFNRISKEINDKIYDALAEYMRGLGFELDEIAEYSAVDISKMDDGRVCVEVRAELDYEALEELLDKIDPIVQEYDEMSYFEPVQPGIAEAWLDLGIESSKAIMGDNQYDARTVVEQNNHEYSVRYNIINTEAPARKMFNDFRFQISRIAPYDDAEYAWCRGEQGVVKCYRSGKLVNKTFYMDADDMDVENYEWCDEVIENSIKVLEQLNHSIKPKMIYNSTSVTSDEVPAYESVSSAVVNGAVRSIENIDGVRYAYEYLTQEDLAEVKDIVLKLLRKEFPNSTFEVYSITLTYDELSMGVLKDDEDFNRGISIKLNRFDYSDNLNKVLNNYTPQLAHELIDEMKVTIFDMSTE